MVSSRSVAAAQCLLVDEKQRESLVGSALREPPRHLTCSAACRFDLFRSEDRDADRNALRQAPALLRLVANDIGDSTTSKMMRIYSENCERLRRHLAALLDMRKLALRPNKLKGDRLELLLCF